MSHQPSDRDPSPSPWQRPDDPPTAPWSIPPANASTSIPPGADPSLPPVTPVSRPKPIRWVVALLATVLVVVTGIGLAMLATGSRTTAAQGPSFLPPDTVLYMEGRLDLPGDQRDNLTSFIGKFPGFADPAAFDLKVNDWLDRLTRDASEGGYVYTADIKPWFDGEFAIGVTEVPEVSAESGGDPLGMSQMPSFVGTLSVTDQAALDTFLSRLRADAAGATFTETTQGDVTIVTYQPAGAPDGTFSYAATDGSLLFAAEPGDIVAALHVRDGAQPSLADSDEFKARFAALPPERLGAVYMDLSDFRASMESGLASLDPTTVGLVRDALDQIPRAMAGSIRAEADRMIVDIVVIPSEGMAVPAARSTALAARVPATSAVYFETRDVGQTIKTFVSAVVEPIMGGDTVLDQVEDFLGSPVEDFLLWMEDAAVSVAVDGDQVTFGLASTVTDSTVAAQRVERLTTAIRAAAAFGQVPFEIEETEVLGAQVTTIAAVSDPAMPLPDDLPFEPSLSYGIHDGIFYLGVGDFVSGAIQQGATDSLAGHADYASALEAAGGATNTGVLYLDLAALRVLFEASIPDEERAAYELEAKPYLEALDRYITVGTIDEGDLSARALLYVE